jgi:hypothetical protein
MCVPSLSLLAEELFPFLAYVRNSRKLERLADAADLLQQRKNYESYSRLSSDQLSKRLEEERQRAVALDDKTFKLTLSLTLGLTLVGTTYAVLLSVAAPTWITKTLAWLVWLAIFYVLAGGRIALGSLRTARSYGYGTDSLLLRDPERQAHLADALPRQELMNQVRHIRNEASFQSLRNGFFVLFVALALFAASKLFDLGPSPWTSAGGPG